MYQPPHNRRRRGLSVLRAGALSRLPPIPNGDAHGLLLRMRSRLGEGRERGATAAGQKRAKRPGQFFQQLPLRRIIGRSGGCRMVHITVAIPDIFHGGMRACVFCRRILVWAWGETTDADFKRGQAGGERIRGVMCCGQFQSNAITSMTNRRSMRAR